MRGIDKLLDLKRRGIIFELSDWEPGKDNNWACVLKGKNKNHIHKVDLFRTSIQFEADWLYKKAQKEFPERFKS